MRGFLAYAGQLIDYQVRFSARVTLSISVHPDGSIGIVAPEGTTRARIEERLQKRASWVLRQRRYFDQFVPRTPKRRYVAGETHLYLGRQYRLKVESGIDEAVRLRGGYFWVSVPTPASSERVRHLLLQWYRAHAAMKLAERYSVVGARFGRILPRIPELAIRSMQKRWGSYSAHGRITLNVDLVRASLPCIDYVITHEMAHVRYPNHGRAFLNLLSQMLPDWERRKVMLERMLA